MVRGRVRPVPSHSNIGEQLIQISPAAIDRGRGHPRKSSDLRNRDITAVVLGLKGPDGIVNCPLNPRSAPVWTWIKIGHAPSITQKNCDSARGGSTLDLRKIFAFSYPSCL